MHSTSKRTKICNSTIYWGFEVIEYCVLIKTEAVRQIEGLLLLPIAGLMCLEKNFGC